MFYAALDVSLRSVAICIIDQDGKVRLERSVPTSSLLDRVNTHEVAAISWPVERGETAIAPDAHLRPRCRHRRA